MKKTIWKFPIEVTDNWNIVMPIGAEILSVQTQGGIPHMWALVDPEAEAEVRKFEIFGTGHKVECNENIERKFIDTFQMSNLGLVFHMFERLK